MASRPAALTFRPTTADDAPAIRELLADAFGVTLTHPILDARVMHWKYWAERPDCPGPRSYVLARGPVLVAHAGVVLSRCLWDGGELRLAHVVDWVRQRSALGAGGILMKRIGNTVDALISIGGSADTLAVLPVLGFEPHREAIGYARSLRPVQRVAGATKRTWRLLPQFLRSVTWKLTSPWVHPSGWETVRVTVDQLLASPVLLPTRHVGQALLERTIGLLRYVMACPLVRTELYAVERRSPNPVRGYLLLAFAPSQARLVDCWINSEDPLDWRALAQVAAERALDDPTAAELITLTNDPLRATAFVDCGFHARQKRSVSLLKTGTMPVPKSGIAVQMIDNDAFCYRSGGDEFWA